LLCCFKIHRQTTCIWLTAVHVLHSLLLTQFKKNTWSYLQVIWFQDWHYSIAHFYNDVSDCCSS